MLFQSIRREIRVFQSVHTRTRTRRWRTAWTWPHLRKYDRRKATRNLVRVWWGSRRCRWRRRRWPSSSCPRCPPAARCTSQRWRLRRSPPRRGRRSETPWSHRRRTACTRTDPAASRPAGPGSKQGRNSSENRTPSLVKQIQTRHPIFAFWSWCWTRWSSSRPQCWRFVWPRRLPVTGPGTCRRWGSPLSDFGILTFSLLQISGHLQKELCQDVTSSASVHKRTDCRLPTIDRDSTVPVNTCVSQYASYIFTFLCI